MVCRQQPADQIKREMMRKEYSKVGFETQSHEASKLYVRMIEQLCICPLQLETTGLT
jgi:hypothetical protein